MIDLNEDPISQCWGRVLRSLTTVSGQSNYFWAITAAMTSGVAIIVTVLGVHDLSLQIMCLSACLLVALGENKILRQCRKYQQMSTTANSYNHSKRWGVQAGSLMAISDLFLYLMIALSRGSSDKYAGTMQWIFAAYGILTFGMVACVYFATHPHPKRPSRVKKLARALRDKMTIAPVHRPLPSPA